MGQHLALVFCTLGILFCSDVPATLRPSFTFKYTANVINISGSGMPHGFTVGNIQIATLTQAKAHNAKLTRRP